MSMLYISIYVIIHLICAYLAAGIWCAYFQGKWDLDDYRGDLREGLLVGLIFGPIALIAVFFSTDLAEYGCSLRKLKKEKK